MTTFANYVDSENPIAIELGILFRPDSKIIIFDIGACEGEDSIRYSTMYPKSTIYSFEPLPNNFQKLQSNIEKFEAVNIQPFCLALAQQIGENTFYVSKGFPPHGELQKDWDYGNKSSSLLPPDKVTTHYNWLSFEETITVATTTLARFCNEQHVEHIDLIHMDVQGAELMVLLGAESYLSSTKAIWLEVEATSLYKNQPLKREIETFMKERSFIKAVDKVDSISGDQLYLNEHFFDRMWIYTNFHPQRLIKKISRGCRKSLSMLHLNRLP